MTFGQFKVTQLKLRTKEEERKKVQKTTQPQWLLGAVSVSLFNSFDLI